MTKLLDVNVLVALAWPNHVHHVLAHRWFRAHRRDGWATCPLTESGFVRVSSNRRVIPGASTPAEAIALLRRMRQLEGHVFWADDVSPADSAAAPFARVAGYRQVTDAHLLALALRRGGALATLDRGLAELARPSERDALEVIRHEVGRGD
ncbi:MAG: PIN domain-containing protein [Gemmatimonadetes bacterium]|nr:PIN domain-containing protein [Gemmatimonadota bacterium]MCY3942635.1 PIN domain-containing protein [Gemmatimonadota bacterium]